MRQFEFLRTCTITLLFFAHIDATHADISPERVQHNISKGIGLPETLHNAHDAGTRINIAGYFYCEVSEDDDYPTHLLAIRRVIAVATAAKVDTEHMLSKATDELSSTMQQKTREEHLRQTSPGILDFMCWGLRDSDNFTVTLSGNFWIQRYERHLVFVGEARQGSRTKGPHIYFARVLSLEEWDELQHSTLTH